MRQQARSSDSPFNDRTVSPFMLQFELGWTLARYTHDRGTNAELRTGVHRLLHRLQWGCINHGRCAGISLGETSHVKSFPFTARLDRERPRARLICPAVDIYSPLCDPATPAARLDDPSFEGLRGAWRVCTPWKKRCAIKQRTNSLIAFFFADILSEESGNL